MPRSVSCVKQHSNIGFADDECLPPPSWIQICLFIGYGMQDLEGRTARDIAKSEAVTELLEDRQKAFTF